MARLRVAPDASRCEARLVARLKSGSLPAEEEEKPFRCEVKPPEDHTQLRHGMACALCRNHYWVHGFDPLLKRSKI